MKNYTQKGESITITAPHAVLSGGMVVSGLIAGVAGHDAIQGALVEAHLEGCYALAKISAQAWTVGQPIYVNANSRLVTNVPVSGAILIGVSIEAAANPSPTGVVRLNGAVPADAVT